MLSVGMGIWDIITAKRRRATRVTAPYSSYTKEFDSEVCSEDLDSVIGSLSNAAELALDEAWLHFETGLAGWKTRTQLSALGHISAIKMNVPSQVLQDCCFALLIDQSGSMRGQNMLLAAAAADCVQDFVRNLGCTVEVLGFTTRSWQGGQSRQKWLRKSRSPSPGRLCDLLHIIYIGADDPGRGIGSWAVNSRAILAL